MAGVGVLFLLRATVSLLRRAELVALRCADVEPADDGWATILARASKTDQAGQGAVLALEPRVVEALRTWLDAAGISDGWVFRRLERDGRAGRSPVGSREVAEVFRRIARELGIAGNISGHSARIGGAHDLVVDGESLVGVMQVGRWRSPAMPALYTLKLSALATAKARKARRDRVSSARLQKVRRPIHRRAATHQRNRYADNQPWLTVHHDHAVRAMLSATHGGRLNRGSRRLCNRPARQQRSRR